MRHIWTCSSIHVSIVVLDAVVVVVAGIIVVLALLRMALLLLLMMILFERRQECKFGLLLAHHRFVVCVATTLLHGLEVYIK